MKSFLNTKILGLLMLSFSFSSFAQNATVSVCPNSPAILKANVPSTTDASGGYVWYKDGIEVSNSALDSFVITEAGIYTLSYINAQGCHSFLSLPVEAVEKTLFATNDSAKATIGTPLNINVVSNDISGCNILDATSTIITGYPLFGSVSINSDGSIKYTSFGISNDVDSFTYVVKDVNGNTSNPAKVFVTTLANAPLPIDLLSFDAIKIKNSHSLLSWEVAGESNPIMFSVERSADAKTFEVIGFVESEPTADQNVRFTFTDEQPLSARNFYRLKITDHDGIISYSVVKMISFSSVSSISVFPNPASNKISVKSDTELPERIELFDVLGNEKQSIIPKLATETLNLTDLPVGVYFIKVKTQGGSVEIFKINKF